jgi:hypothetical protein
MPKPYKPNNVVITVGNVAYPASLFARLEEAGILVESHTDDENRYWKFQPGKDVSHMDAAIRRWCGITRYRE